MTTNAIANRIAKELNVQPKQVSATVALLDEGSTVPFIARYRKEMTGSLDDTQLRLLEERLRYLRELEERRLTILNSIEEQDKLSPELKTKILAADNKTSLEDLYLPYKKKRRTKGQIAIEAGLEPLADKLFNQPDTDPETEAQGFLGEGVDDSKAALDGARYILMERFAQEAEILATVRSLLERKGIVTATLAPNKEQEAQKFKDYFDYREAYKTVPSHRALALFRGRNESLLYVNMELEQIDDVHPVENIIANFFNISHQGRPADDWLQKVVQWTSKIKVLPSIELELMSSLKERSDEEAIKVFTNNLKDLLLAAPAGPKATMGLDPGFRSGTKIAVIDKTGKLVDHATIYPHPPQKQWDKSLATLAALAKKHKVDLISIGNGTASRETDSLAAELLKNHPELKLSKIIVSEAGASVYSASEFAAKEFPDLDVTIRGAVSIARRLQDPLAELVKIEPKAIGVGQYQHDVNQYRLARSLSAAVEDCVNEVGVDINTASAALLSHVSGLNDTIAKNIIDFRDANGRFDSRETIKKVARFGDKTFEQAAGFLKIMGGKNPLDCSSVHPEAYPLVNNILSKSNTTIAQLIGDKSILSKLRPEEYQDDTFGLPTIKDVISELEKPGRDPRPEFKMANLKEGVEKISDLEIGMILEGTVSNVANFGAFVDLGVHQDGLVHISALSDKFIDDPRKVVKAGDIVKVKVMEVDEQRKRIALTMRLTDEPEQKNAKNSGKPKSQTKSQTRSKPSNKGQNKSQSYNKSQSKAPQNSAFAQALSSVLKK